jgi:hypothetical protein
MVSDCDTIPQRGAVRPSLGLRGYAVPAVKRSFT